MGHSRQCREIMETYEQSGWKEKPSWSVVVVFENENTQKQATAFCDGLVERFWSKCGFDFSWWSIGDLARADAWESSLDHAASADILIATVEPGREMELFRDWLEHWRARRGDREGVVVGLLDPCTGCEPLRSEKHARLREAAHRAGLDYLTELPATLADLLPASLESYSERADQMSGLLTQILERPTPPRTFGA